MTDTRTVDLTIIKVLTNSLDKLVGACLDDKGQPRTPSKEDILEARKMLPEGYQHTLTKKKTK